MTSWETRDLGGGAPRGGGLAIVVTAFERLDATIDRELRRGEVGQQVLRSQRRDLLRSIVERELVHSQPPSEATLYVLRRPSGPFRATLFRRRLDWLIAHRFVRRERDLLRPTVAGIGAVRPMREVGTLPQPLRDRLRLLRRDEIGTL